MSKAVEIDVKEFEKFFKKLNSAAKKDFKKQIAVWFEACGFEFLRVVQDEIIRKEVVETRLLLNSFEKGEKDNVWKVSDGGLTLEVGTNVKYAEFVNDGHWTNKKGQQSRFVPGHWQGDRFIYAKGADTGMILRQKWVEGSHYWESAIRIFERIFEKSLDNKIQEWIDRYFKV